MRKALNENPVVQVVLLGVLGIVVAFLFMTRVMSQSDTAEESPPADPAAAATTATAPAAPVPAETTAPAPAPVEPTPTAGAPGFEAGPGLPESVVSAYKRGDVAALLVVQPKGVEDRKLAADIGAVEGRGDTSVFVVASDDVARYSRIAEGVNLDRVPALVVIEPKSQTRGELPVATISYGFRGADSLQQAIRDALYKGKQLPYHPG